METVLFMSGAIIQGGLVSLIMRLFTVGDRAARCQEAQRRLAVPGLGEEGRRKAA